MSDKSQSTPVRLFVVDDHPLFTSLLSEIVADDQDLKIVGTAQSAKAAIDALRETESDIVVLDLMLPDMSGIEVIEVLRRENLANKIVVCSGVGTQEAIEMAYSLGAHAFIEKTSNVQEFISTLKGVAAGESPMTPRVSRILRELVRRKAVTKPLCPDDIGILRMLARHETIKTIAAEMGLSSSAVYKARERIAERIGATGPRDLYLMAARLGLLTTDGGELQERPFPEPPTETGSAKPVA
jgi:DNA-binding NarL/FixJ family response regulator